LRTFDTSVVDVPDPIFGNSDIQSSAAISPDGTAYIGLHSGTLWALRDPVGAGNQLAARWNFHPSGGSSWHATPAIARDGTVYVRSMNGKLYAIVPPVDRETESAGAPPVDLANAMGTIRWTFRFAGFPGKGKPVTSHSPPAGADGIGSGASPTIGP